MILTPVAINAHGRIGPMFRQQLYGTPPPDIPPRKQFKPNRPNAKAMYDRATTLPAPIGAFSSKQTRDGNSYNQTSDSPHHSQKFYGLSHYAPTPSITTIQQLGLRILTPSALSSSTPSKSSSILRHHQPSITMTSCCLATKLLAYC